MPKVPTYDNFQSQVAGPSNVQFQAPSGPTPGAIAADQASQFGRAATAAGDAIGKIALDVQDQVNQVRVNDAMNQTRIAAQDLAYDKDTGYLNLKGNAALTRPDGQSLNQEYGSKLQEQISSLSSSLGNDAQRRAFQMQANDLTTQFHGQVETHMLQQFHTYSDSVDDATVKLASDGARSRWKDADFINGHKDPATGEWVNGVIAQAKGAIVEKMNRAGLKGAPADAALLAGISQIHTGIVLAALENNDPKYALDYLDQARKKGEISADDSLKLQGHVNQNVWLNQSQTAVQTATAKAMPQIAPNNADRIVQITAQSESGTRDFNPDGSAVTSSSGAKYKMQVMPATAANPGYGIPPAASDTPAEYNRVGEAKLQILLGRYGDPAKAWAAYNAGEGNVDKAIADASKKGGDWMGALAAYQSADNHKQTVDYVTKNVKALGNGTAVMPRQTELEFVNAAIAQLPAGAPPQVVKMTHDAAATQFGVINKSLNEQGDNAFADSQRWIANNQGRTVDQMPPELMDTMKRYAPGKIDDLYKFSKVLERGDVVTNMAAYNTAKMYPEELAKMSDAQFLQFQKTNFSLGDQKSIANLRADQVNGTSNEGALNNKALTQTLANRLYSIGIDPKPKATDISANTRIGTIVHYAHDQLFAQQTALGRKMSPQEVETQVDILFAKDAKFRSTILGIDTGSTTQNMMSMKWGDVPSTSKDTINKVFAANNQPNASESDKLRYYWTWKNKNAK